MAVAPWIVSDALWKRVESLLPRQERRFRYPGRKRLDDRAALQGILFVLHTGIAWGTCRWSLALGRARRVTGGWTSGSGRVCGSGCTRCFLPSCRPRVRSSGRAQSPTPATCSRKRGRRDGPEPC
jgi:hypothetical protein